MALGQGLSPNPAEGRLEDLGFFPYKMGTNG